MSFARAAGSVKGGVLARTQQSAKGRCSQPPGPGPGRAAQAGHSHRGPARQVRRVHVGHHPG